MHELRAQRHKKPVLGTAIALPSGWWLWNGVEWPRSEHTQLFHFQNGTYMNLKTGEVFQDLPDKA